jgi:hypothetical protein
MRPIFMRQTITPGLHLTAELRHPASAPDNEKKEGLRDFNFACKRKKPLIDYLFVT